MFTKFVITGHYVKGIQFFTNGERFNSLKENNDFLNQRNGIVTCLLIETVSQVSDVAFGPLVSRRIRGATKCTVTVHAIHTVKGHTYN